MDRRRVACVGAVVVDDDGRLLLVRRGQEPARGLWSIPGGRVEADESDEVATAREVLEETALAVDVVAFLGSVERDAPDGSLYVIRDFVCRARASADLAAVRAGDDAEDVGWFSADEVRSLDTSPGLVEALTRWRVLPRLP
jgi:ADP-ribose pyrophosphatase YjhB (NUDIX family)